AAHGTVRCDPILTNGHHRDFVAWPHRGQLEGATWGRWGRCHHYAVHDTTANESALPGGRMLKRLALHLTSGLLAVSVGFSVAAQQHAPDLAKCLNKGRAFSFDVQISRCTAALQSAHETPTSADRALVYVSRGIAYYNKGEYERAIADFSEAIKLNP